MSPRQTAFLSILTDAGYLPRVEEDEVVFRVEGNRYTIQTFRGDDSYARLLTAFTIPKNVTRHRLITQANKRNSETKAVKTVVEFKQGLVVFSVEQFLGDPDHARPCFERALTAVRLSADRFFVSLEPKNA